MTLKDDALLWLNGAKYGVGC